MPFEYSQEVIDDYEKLFESEEEYDVIIYSGENENIKEFHAHSLVLRTRSKYFRTAFSKEWSEKKDEKFIFRKPNISPQIFEMILRFIYCGKIDLEKLQVPDILKLLMAVDEIDIQTLAENIQNYLTKYQVEFLEENPIEILEATCQNESFTILWNLCLGKICEEPEMLFNSDKFITLKAALLELLLKRNDLSLDEIVIWDNLIKWCLAQHPDISQNPTQWNKDEIAILEKTIHRFIPLIRFDHISSEDFIIKVYPFKEIIPNDLVNNKLIYHMAPNKQLNVILQPPRQPKCIYDSILLRSQHFAIFSDWIEKKNDSHYNIENIPYKFDLLCRASRDGNTSEVFHAKCDHRGATIIIAKISNSNHIVGGYNPLFWDTTSDWKSTNNSFIFSFTNTNDFQTAKVGHVTNTSYAMRCSSAYGPIFGGGYDLFHSVDSTWKSHKHSYPEIDIPQDRKMGNYNVFNVENYEVFQVVKK
ncbi:hypothetical protein GLOIN_2v1838247 [Rhizophagus irregularis DAOM 181602=DAOM 197198]|uniref:Uncharacterized protein n=2 Tax=Rhizophagus irregularis TaxID=588596 RepID=U9SGZ9_RHIID|nr:hypothetical protein GLOIN_2v1838247 [Rhizophagus irregularis DAOM 181602=DAOM 197198]EXX67506.1 hypothetical protein RirG_113680 [Rhizophagus irregularis DAOM 197198w]POG76269.1 hypothetical protein GLOIN_2v1838247 [Rhizophagus irregularis DAOM 181602=DAOM 197198]|eukprot:XP_025183135.1 hypothetical protein GLOIN_2v1838247 [Rhizophagus irregularis DAOM 181602=DAOM 197198]